MIRSYLLTLSWSCMDSFLLGASSMPCPEAGVSFNCRPLWVSGGGDWRPSFGAEDIVYDVEV